MSIDPKNIALHNAAEKGLLKQVQNMIKDYHANIHSNDDYALRKSILNKHYNIAKFLIENGANIHVYDDLPLRVSADRNNFEMVKFLIEYGADIHAINEEALKSTTDIEIIKYLIDNNADIHSQDDYVLRKHAENGNLEIVKLLVEHGANIHAYNDEVLKSKHQNIVDYISSISQKNYLFENSNPNSKCDSSKLTNYQLEIINKNFNKNFTKDDICEEIKLYFNSKKELKDTFLPKCTNNTTILLTDLTDVPSLFFYNKEINGKMFCGDIRELVKIKTNKNPWTNENFSNELVYIKKELDMLENIIQDLYDNDEMPDNNTINKTIEMTIRRAMSNVLQELRYPKDVNNYIIADENTLNNFILELKDENIISENDTKNIQSILDISAKKLALANLLQLILKNDTSYIYTNGIKISDIRVILEEVYNKLL